MPRDRRGILSMSSKGPGSAWIDHNDRQLAQHKPVVEVRRMAHVKDNANAINRLFPNIENPIADGVYRDGRRCTRRMIALEFVRA